MIKMFEKYRYLLIIIFSLTIVTITYLNYKNTEKIIIDNYNQRQQLVESSIINSFNHVSDAYRIAEQELNKEMKEYSYILHDYYTKNPDVHSWDLDQFKEEFGWYDIYLIDSNLEVILSTYKEDIGLDFKKYPGFSKVLKDRLQGNSFVVDRLDLATNSGEIKKYSYLPTPDNKYLLELSANIKDKYPSLEEINIFTEAEKLKNRYKIVGEIAFYKYSPQTKNAGKLSISKDPIDTDISPEEKNLVRQAFESKEVQILEMRGDDSDISTFIPALVETSDSEESWWNSFVIGITYKNNLLYEEIIRNRNLFLTSALLMLVVFIIFITIVVYLLKRFKYMAYHDQLTGLPNRKLFVEEAEKMMERSNKSRNKLAIVFIDVKNFKEINDTFGHDIGDKILTRVAAKLKDSLRKDDCISRLGGDEFTMAISGISSREEANNVAERIVDLFVEPIEIAGGNFIVDITLGISMYPEEGRQLEELIKKADYAMYKAKRQQEHFVQVVESPNIIEEYT